jgi:Arc/MetJ-type ribon-helix-helix transcriptional regulator
MKIALSKPELEKFVQEQVEQGNFTSPTDVVEAALAYFQDELNQEMDDETVAAIERASVQLDRGEGRPLDEIAVELRKKYSRP